MPTVTFKQRKLEDNRILNIGRNNWRQVFLDGNHVLNLNYEGSHNNIWKALHLPHEPYTPFWIRHLKLLDLKFEGIEKARNFVTTALKEAIDRGEDHIDFSDLEHQLLIHQSELRRERDNLHKEIGKTTAKLRKLDWLD